MASVSSLASTLNSASAHPSDLSSYSPRSFSFFLLSWPEDSAFSATPSSGFFSYILVKLLFYGQFLEYTPFSPCTELKETEQGY
jgi:hypothetical protein